MQQKWPHLNNKECKLIFLSRRHKGHLHGKYLTLLIFRESTMVHHLTSGNIIFYKMTEINC